MTDEQTRPSSSSTPMIAAVGVLAAIGVVGAVAVAISSPSGGGLMATVMGEEALSPYTIELLTGLEEDIEFVVYLTPDLPPPYDRLERATRALLSEYERAGNGRVQVRYVDVESDEAHDEADEDGVPEVMHQLLDDDSVRVVNAYRGLVVRSASTRVALPVINETRGLEYEITSRLHFAIHGPTTVGVVRGHGSPGVAEGLSSLQDWLERYELREVDTSTEISPELSALLLVDPTDALSDTELRRINEYVMRGGSLGVFGGASHVTVTGEAPTAAHVSTGVDQLLTTWGVQFGEGLVADTRCGRVPLRTSVGMMIPVAYPPAPIIEFDEEQQTHPVTWMLEQVPIFFTSPLVISDRFDELGGSVLGRSSPEGSWVITGDPISLRPREPREWTPTDTSGPHVVLVALEGRLPSAFAEPAGGITAPARSEQDVRVLVAGSGATLRSEFLPQRAGSSQTASTTFPLNAIDWLAANDGLIAARASDAAELVSED